jgi:hypothetical protein
MSTHSGVAGDQVHGQHEPTLLDVFMAS